MRWTDLIRLPVAQLPRVPIDPIAGTTDAIVVDFRQTYGTFCLDFLLSNLDFTNALTYYINNSANGKTLSAGGEIAVNNVLVERIRIVPDGTTGNFELLPFLLPRELLR